MSKSVWGLEDTLSLSRSQENIWALGQSFPGTSMNNICATMRIRGRLDIALIQKNLNQIIASNPSRLTAFLHNEEFLSAISKIDSIVCGGEAFPGDLLQRLKLHTCANIYNQYGPSGRSIR